MHAGDPPLPLADAFHDAWGRAGGRRLDDSAAHGVLALFFASAAWWPWLDEARTLLDGAELDRVARKRRPRDGDELALAYGLHRLVLGRVLARDPRAVPLGRDALGRPCLPDDHPQTSLSHAEGVAAIAVSLHGPVGIDVEPAARAAHIDEVAAAVLHPAERAALGAVPAGDRDAALLALWVRKEALLKAAGIGLAREMDGFRAPEGVPVPLPAVAGPDGADTVLRMVDAGPGWLAAVACPPGVAPDAAWLRPRAR